MTMKQGIIVNNRQIINQHINETNYQEGEHLNKMATNYQDGGLHTEDRKLVICRKRHAFAIDKAIIYRI